VTPLLLLLACGDRTAPADDTSGTEPGDLRVPLRWVRASDTDDWLQARAGLYWQLANLGAVPPRGDPGLLVLVADEDRVDFTLDLGAVGFPDAALPALAEAVAFVAETDEVALMGGLDTGAFFLRTLYEPWHYYAITGACAERDAWRELHLAPDPALYAITESWLVEGDRLDHYTAAPPEVADIAHFVEEGPGDIQEGSFDPVEGESIDVLPNGALRYAVYDEAGGLLPWGLHSPAGQPGRCLWCHEDHLQRGDKANGADGYVTAEVFLAEIDTQTAAIEALRASLDTDVWADPVADHEDGEILTEMWLHAPPGRLAREWYTDEATVQAALDAEGLTTSVNDEYPEVGPVVTRADAERVFDALLPVLAAEPGHPFEGWTGPYVPVETLPSAREPAEAPLDWGDPDQLRCE